MKVILTQSTTHRFLFELLFEFIDTFFTIAKKWTVLSYQRVKSPLPTFCGVPIPVCIKIIHPMSISAIGCRDTVASNSRQGESFKGHIMTTITVCSVVFCGFHEFFLYSTAVVQLSGLSVVIKPTLDTAIGKVKIRQLLIKLAFHIFFLLIFESC